MDGFIALVIDLVKANGLAHADIHKQRVALTLPGYFQPTELWDLLVVNEGRLVAAVEVKARLGRHSAITSTTGQKKRSARPMISGQLT